MALHLIPSPAAPTIAPLHCSYSEASYFDGYAFQHIAAWQDAKRLARIARNARDAIQRERRANRRAY